MYRNSESGDAEWITMLQVVCCKGSVDYMEFGMDRCDLDDWHARINQSQFEDHRLCMQVVSESPPHKLGGTNSDEGDTA